MKRLITILAVTCVAAPAMAGLIGSADVREVSVSPGAVLTLYGKNFIGGVGAQAGIYNLEVLNATLPIGNRGFCIEMQYSTSSLKPYDIRTLDDAPRTQGNGPGADGTMGATKAGMIAALWGQHFAEIGNDNIKAAAFQAAVWEIVYENSGTLDVSVWDNTENTFKVTGDANVIAQANAWLQGGTNWNGAKAHLVAVSNRDYQDYVVPVPAPAAAGLCFLGLGLVGWVRRRLA